MATIKDRLNALGTKEASGQIATFDTNTIAPLDECKIHFLPWQEGEGDPSPENVRPIHGWNEFNVYHTGKNLFNWNVPFKNPDNIENNASVKRIFTPYTYCIGATGTNYFNPNRISEYEISNGKISWTQTSGGYGIGFPIPAKENTQYIFSCSGNRTVYAAYYAEDGTYLGYFTISSSGKFTTPANTTIVVIVCSKSSAPYEDTWMSNIQVELGSTITSYEPYKGQSIPVNLLHPGKNLFTIDPYLQAVNGITLIQRQDGGFEFSGTATGGGQFRKPIYLEAGTYVLSNYGSVASTAGTWYIRLLDKDATQLYSLSSASLTQINFTLSTSDDYICQIAFSSSFNPASVIIYPQLQLGSTATTFQPYIYPPKSSKNLLNPFTNPIWQNSNYVVHSDGSVTINGSDGRGWTSNQIIPLPLKQGTYTISWLNLSGGVLHIYTSDDGYTTDHQSSKGIATFTLNNDGAIKFKFSPTTVSYSYPVRLIYMLQEGQVAHPVQPYYLQEPVYGGYIDLVQGKVVVDWIKTKIRDLSWNTWSNAGLMYSQQIDRKPGSAIYINNASIDGTGNPQHKNAGVLGYYETNVNYPKTLYIQTNISKEQENYQTARLNYIYETFTDSYIIYQLNTPIQYSLTPQYIKALFGVNNIYSDTNDITQITYKQYYDTDILETRRKIALNEPHIESASGSIANFNTDMSAPLKQNKIYFYPIQEGEEDPSPDNIRPITGWSNINVYKAKKNIAKVIGYSAVNTTDLYSNRNLTNSYGTTLSTIDYDPETDGAVVITQSDWDATPVSSYRNGYLSITIEGLVLNQTYDISFRVTDITNDPLQVGIKGLQLTGPGGSGGLPNQIIGDRVIYKKMTFTPYKQAPSRMCYQLRNAGMSFTLSEFMVTPRFEDQSYEEYDGEIYPIYFNGNLFNFNIPQSYPDDTSSSNSTKRILTPNTYIIGLSPSNYYRSDWYPNWMPEAYVTNQKVYFKAGNASGYGIGFVYNLVPGATYTVKTNKKNISTSEYPRGISMGIAFSYYTSDGTYISNKSTVNSILTVTIPNNAAITVLVFYSNTINQTYEYSNIRLYRQDIQQYGGYIDLNNNELVVTDKCITITGDEDITYRVYKTSIYSDCNLFNDSKSGDYKIYGKSSIVGTSTNGTLNTGWIMKAYQDRGIQFYNVMTNWGLSQVSIAALIEKLQEWNNNGTPLQICYELAEPIHYNLDQIDLIKTVKGLNNIYSDLNGSIENKYWTHKKEDKFLIWNQYAGKIGIDSWVARNTSYATAEFEGEVATLTWLQQRSGSYASLTFTMYLETNPGDIFYISYMINPSKGGLDWGSYAADSQKAIFMGTNIPANTWTRLKALYTSSLQRSQTTTHLGVVTTATSTTQVGMTCSIKSPIVVNLTMMFGAGNEPTLEEFEALCIRNGINLTESQSSDRGLKVKWN